jgi:hypothetical protein
MAANMNLIENWDQVLKKAWSVKFNAAAALFGGLEVAVQLIQPASIPNGLFAGFGAVVSICAAVSRVLAQKEISNDNS